jgi:hypothetical protein
MLDRGRNAVPIISDMPQDLRAAKERQHRKQRYPPGEASRVTHYSSEVTGTRERRQAAGG